MAPIHNKPSGAPGEGMTGTTIGLGVGVGVLVGVTVGGRGAHTDGDPRHLNPISTAQAEEQPSPFVALPSQKSPSSQGTLSRTV